MKTITIICAWCGEEVEKPLNEYKRQIKKGNTRFFCNLSCATFMRNKENPPTPPENNIDISLYSGNRLDELSPFRWFVARSKYRSKRKQYVSDLTPEYLKSLWDEQSGKCPFTGWSLLLPANTMGWESDYNPANASLDRIDNSKGYLQGNVRFVAVMANLARQTFTDDQVIKFCKAVTDNFMT
jgi:YHS domain-containing protein